MLMQGKTLIDADLCDCCARFMPELIELPNGGKQSWRVCRECIEVDEAAGDVAELMGGSNGH